VRRRAAGRSAWTVRRKVPANTVRAGCFPTPRRALLFDHRVDVASLGARDDLRRARAWALSVDALRLIPLGAEPAAMLYAWCGTPARSPAARRGKRVLLSRDGEFERLWFVSIWGELVLVELVRPRRGAAAPWRSSHPEPCEIRSSAAARSLRARGPGEVETARSASVNRSVTWRAISAPRRGPPDQTCPSTRGRGARSSLPRRRCAHRRRSRSCTRWRSSCPVAHEPS